MRLHRLLLAGLVALAACEGTPRTTLSAPEARKPIILQEALTVPVLTRNVPLSRDVSTSAQIGKAGGEILLPDAGLKITIPKNALVPPSRSNHVTITVTALAGDEVAYRFEPHGLVFMQPITLQQDIKETSAYKYPELQSLMEGAYWESLDPVLSKAKVTEFRPSYFDVAGGKLRFDVDHFSGYLVSVGRR